MAQASDTNLHSLLTKLCEGARDVTNADFVVLYPLSRDGVNYDTKAIATAGDLRDPEYLLEHMPRREGTAAYISRQGTLVINDVAHSKLEFDGFPLSQQRYIMHEAIAKQFLSIVLPKLKDAGVVFLVNNSTISLIPEGKVMDDLHIIWVPDILEPMSNNMVLEPSNTFLINQ